VIKLGGTATNSLDVELANQTFTDSGQEGGSLRATAPTLCSRLSSSWVLIATLKQKGSKPRKVTQNVSNPT